MFPFNGNTLNKSDNLSGTSGEKGKTVGGINQIAFVTRFLI